MKHTHGFLFLVVGFLVGIMSCSTQQTKRAKTTRGTWVDESVHIVQLTPYCHGGLYDLLGPAVAGPPLSLEAMKALGSDMPAIPMSTAEFVQYVTLKMARLNADGVVYTKYGNESASVLVATIIRAKFGFGRDYAQVSRNNKPCGVWQVEPKQSGPPAR